MQISGATQSRATLLIPTILVCLGLAGEAGGLEIFRIGGEAEPRPDQPGMVFHQLQWSNFAEQFGLDQEALGQGILRPRFLSMEENIARTALERGGGPYVPGNVGHLVSEGSKAMIDGDPTTFYEWGGTGRSSSSAQSFIQSQVIIVDLGDLFNISRIRLFTPETESGHYPDKLDIAPTAEAERRATILNNEVVVRILENVEDTLDVSFPPMLARNVRLRLYRISLKVVEVAEVEVYGEGFVSQASYVSSFVDLGEPAIWGDLRWRGHRDPQAGVSIQSRAGKDLDPAVYWRFTGRGAETTRFAAGGQLLDAASYARLKPGEEAETTYDTENWSFWTAPYNFADSSATPILSPSPNSVLQLQVNFQPTVRAGGALHFIEFSATKPPLVEEVWGEISPRQVELGETAQFTYAIKATIRPQHSGFDRIEIAAPFGLAGVDALRISGAPVDFTVRAERSDSTLFSVQLPRHQRSEDSARLIEVVFRAPVLRYGTAFNGWLRDTSRPLELAQPIRAGDADARVESEGLVVRTSISEHLLANLEVAPRIITPDGDGINEVVTFSFDLLQLTDGAPLKLEIFDLSGRRQRSLHAGEEQSGALRFSWDGRDEEGERVLPGLYLYRIAVQSEEGRDRKSGTLAVVY